MKISKIETINMKTNAQFNEKWVQEKIADDPSILGLGDLVLKDKERIQPKAGRLDLLLQDSDTNHRYEVEIQLGATDESHIIRTIEYWDIERKRYPQYEHTAVIVAENITSRFLNVIQLFNGSIPIIAIQMGCIKLEEAIGLQFITILNQMELGLVDEDEEVHETADRNYWVQKASQKSLSLADSIYNMIRSLDESFELKYNKFYIGLSKNGSPNTFVILRPKKNFIKVEPRLPLSDEYQNKIDNSGLDVMEYDSRWGRYRMRITSNDLEKNSDPIKEIIEMAYKYQQ